MERLKKDIVASLFALGILLLSCLIAIIVFVCRRGVATKGYVVEKWQRVRRRSAYQLKKLKRGDDPNVRYE